MSNFNRTGQNHHHGQQNKPYEGNAQLKELKEQAAMPLPHDFVHQAMLVMQKIRQEEIRNNLPKEKRLTTSKIRKILTLVNDLRESLNQNNGPELTSEEESAIQYLRMRTAYECGRDKSVKKMVESSNLIGYLLDIKKDKKKLANFITYVEALVAYHRFFGGEDK